MYKNYTDKLEILAPAGSYDTFKAVINAGADAVYLGGQMFGARAYAGNLSEEELLQAIDYAHLHNRKIYLTVNTLVKNNELEYDLYNYIKPYYEAGLDAVIVQDYGVMKFINDYFPGLDIHASTQMTVTSAEYTDFLKQYNVTRIVPARELSLADLRKIHEYTDMEIECFVHGALCYCYSGQCLMSSFIGGRSGNRGRCAQPCRLEYNCDGHKSAILSLKDLSTLEILPDIIEAGVYSMKIEGRMKSPEYAAGVTSIYRKYADMYIEKGKNKYKVDEQDNKNLLMLFDRGGITKGYYVMHNGADMIANEHKSDKSLQDKNNYEALIKKQYIDTDVKEPLDITVKLAKGMEAVLTVTDIDGNVQTVSGDIIQAALNKAMTKEDINKQIVKLGATPYYAKSVEINMEENIFVPNKSLNELRRQAVEALSNARLLQYRRPALEYKSDRQYDKNNNQYKGISVRVLTFEQGKSAIDAMADRICIEAELMDLKASLSLLEQCKEKNIECFYCLPRIYKNEYINYLIQNIDTIINAGFTGFYIRNIAEYYFLIKHGCRQLICMDSSIYIFNNLTVEALNKLEISGYTYPLELNSKELKNLKIPEAELIVYGKVPLMVTSGCIDKSRGKCHNPNSAISHIIDRKNARLDYISCCRYCYNVIYNNVPIYLLDKAEQIKEINPSYISLSFSTETAEEVKMLICTARNSYEKGLSCDTPKEFTRGHFTRGVE